MATSVDAWGGSWAGSWALTWTYTIGDATTTPRGGDDVPRRRSPHRGPNEKLELEKRTEREAFVESIRASYRELTAAPETRERAEEIVEPTIEPILLHGESEAAHRDAMERRAAALDVERVRLDRLSRDGEIALRLLHVELREAREADDELAIAMLLSVVL